MNPRLYAFINQFGKTAVATAVESLGAGSLPYGPGDAHVRVAVEPLTHKVNVIHRRLAIHEGAHSRAVNGFGIRIPAHGNLRVAAVLAPDRHEFIDQCAEGFRMRRFPWGSRPSYKALSSSFRSRKACSAALYVSSSLMVLLIILRGVRTRFRGECRAPAFLERRDLFREALSETAHADARERDIPTVS